MIELLSSVALMLSQTGSEKKLTVLYILLFMLFLVLLFIDSRTNKKLTGPKAIKITIIVLIFVAAICLLIAYFNL